MAKKRKPQDDDMQDQDVLESEVQSEPVDIDGDDDTGQSGSGNYHIGVIQVDLGEKDNDEETDEESVDVNEYEEIDDTSAKKASQKLLRSISTEEGEEDENNTETFLGDVNFDPDESWPLDD